VCRWLVKNKILSYSKDAVTSFTCLPKDKTKNKEYETNNPQSIKQRPRYPLNLKNLFPKIGKLGVKIFYYFNRRCHYSSKLNASVIVHRFINNALHNTAKAHDAKSSTGETDESTKTEPNHFDTHVAFSVKISYIISAS
jgi:hypothetical protein